MTTNEYKQMLDKIKVFTSGPSKKRGEEKSSEPTLKTTAFPINKLVSGGVSSQFFGIVERQTTNKKGTSIF